MDLEDQAALDHYCYAVAGVVGELLTALFMAYRPPLAVRKVNCMEALSVSFGLGLQLDQHRMKDVWDDANGGCAGGHKRIGQASVSGRRQSNSTLID